MNHRLEVIGISGKAGSGKDFLASQVLVPFYGFKPYALAWPIKAMAYARTERSYEYVYLDKPPEIRALLQVLGTEEGRDVYGENYWTYQAFAWMQTLARAGYGNKFVITDVRFPNEVEFVKSLGGKVVRMEFGEGRSPALSGAAAQHISETALDDYDLFDVTIINAGGTTARDMEEVLKITGVI